MTALATPDIALVIDGLAYSGWTQVEVERGLDSMSGRFDLRLSAKERTAAEDWPIKQGAECTITLAGEVLITGYVDDATRFMDPEDRGIQIRGRDKAADLVDCSAVHSPGSWNNRKLEQIAADLSEPFGIPVNVTGDTGAPFRKFALQQGETVFDAIERMARYRGLVCWSPGDGTLQVGNPDTGLRTGNLTQGVNVTAARASRNAEGRYSTYIVKGQASGDDRRSGAAVAQVKAVQDDPTITRYRPLLIIGEEQADTASLKRRAEWEAAVRSGRSAPATVTVPGWIADDGQPFQFGRRTAVRIPGVELDGEMLVERVKFTRDDEAGTLTELSIVPPEAWTQLAEPEADL